MDAPRQRTQLEKNYSDWKLRSHTSSKLYNINHKTVIKWRKRKEKGVADKLNTPKKTNTVLSTEDEAIIMLSAKLPN